MPMTRKQKADPRAEVESDDTMTSTPVSDEARLPNKGALRPEHVRDGTAEASDVHLLARRAVESSEDPEAPLDFEHPSADARDRDPDAGDESADEDEPD